MSSESDKTIIQVLRERDGSSTHVLLVDGRRLTVFNIAWGYDMGDDSAHVTTNISPSVEGHPVDIFFTRDVTALVDPETGAVIFNIDAE